jgi:hypothetical protein
VVLGGEKRGDVGAVAEADETDFVAFEELFDDNLLRGFAEARAVEEAAGGFEGDVARLAKDDALPAARPSALTTMGGWNISTVFSSSAAVVQTAYRAVGI